MEYENHVICNNQFAYLCPYNVLVTVYISSCILYSNILFQMIWFWYFEKKKKKIEKNKSPQMFR